MPLRFSYNSALVVLSALLPTYLIRFQVFGIPTNFLEVTIWLLFVVGLLNLQVRQRWAQAAQTIPKPFLLLSGLFLIAAVISTVISPHAETSLGILKGWIATPMLFAFMIFAAAKQVSNIQYQISQSLILSGLVMGLLGLSQVGTLERIQGIYDVPNSLALFLAPIIVLAVFGSKVKGQRLFSRYAAVIMFLALLFTQSVAGVLSVIVALGFYLVIRKLRLDWSLGIGHWSFIAAIAILSLFILAPKIAYLTQPGSSAHVRLQLWSISWDLIKENPVFGIGLGTFEPAYQNALHKRFENYELRITNNEAAPPLPEFVFRDPHNWVLSFWLNTGLLGLVSFTSLNFATIHWSLKTWKFIRNWKLSPPQRDPAAAGEIRNYQVAAALLALLLFGLVDTIYWKNDLATLHLLLVSFALLGYNQHMKKGKKNDMPRRQTLFWDVDPATIDPEKHARYVIERILDFGHDDEVRWMWEHYSPTLLRSAVEQSRVLHPPTRVLWQALIQNQ